MKAKDPTMVGVSGIVTKETKNTFNIITEEDIVRGEA